MKQARYFGFILLAVISILNASCTKEDKDTVVELTSSAVLTSQDWVQTGFAAESTSADIIAQVAIQNGRILADAHSFSFNSNGTFSTTKLAGTTTGTWSISGSVLTITEGQDTKTFTIKTATSMAFVLEYKVDILNTGTLYTVYETWGKKQ